MRLWLLRRGSPTHWSCQTKQTSCLSLTDSRAKGCCHHWIQLHEEVLEHFSFEKYWFTCFFQSFVTYMWPLFPSVKITMNLCGLFLTIHWNTTSNYSNHSMKTACLEVQKKGKRALSLHSSWFTQRHLSFCPEWDPFLIFSYHCTWTSAVLSANHPGMTGRKKAWVIRMAVLYLCKALGQAHSPKESR